MPVFVSDLLLPGSERAVESVNTKLVRDIVRDLGHGPARLPTVDPSSQSPRPVEPTMTPLRPPAGIDLIDKMCLAADAQDRLQKMEALSRTITNLQADRDAEIARLQAEIERLQAELKKAESSTIKGQE